MKTHYHREENNVVSRCQKCKADHKTAAFSAGRRDKQRIFRAIFFLPDLPGDGQLLYLSVCIVVKNNSGITVFTMHHCGPGDAGLVVLWIRMLHVSQICLRNHRLLF
ncbi:hypothetical protein ACFL9S_00015 [Erwinia sp. AnSW2-5]|uniref:hypothetical protein n=1 Tax=Erwinia sp. AnSW2-5 TaxID=3367692 RepID=UPI00385D68A3